MAGPSSSSAWSDPIAYPTSGAVRDAPKTTPPTTPGAMTSGPPLLPRRIWARHLDDAPLVEPVAVNVRATCAKRGRHRGRRGRQIAASGIAERDPGGAARRRRLAQLQRGCAGIGDAEQGEVGVGIEGDHEGVVNRATDRDGRVVATGHHVRIGDHVGRGDEEAAPHHLALAAARARDARGAGDRRLGQCPALRVRGQVDRRCRRGLEAREEGRQPGGVEQCYELAGHDRGRRQPLCGDAQRHGLSGRRRQAGRHAGREHAADEPHQECDVCHADGRAADRVERPQAALPEAVAHRRTAGRPDRFANDHERAEADQGRDRPHRLLDDRQLVAEHGRQQQRQAEPDGGADKAEHRPEEAGARAGDQADHEQDEDARVDEVHGPTSLAAGRKRDVGPSSAPV